MTSVLMIRADQVREGDTFVYADGSESVVHRVGTGYGFLTFYLDDEMLMVLPQAKQRIRRTDGFEATGVSA